MAIFTKLTEENRWFLVTEIHPGYFVFLTKQRDEYPTRVLYVLTTQKPEDAVLQITGIVGSIPADGVIRWGKLQKFCAFSLQGNKAAISDPSADYWIVRHPTEEQKRSLNLRKPNLGYPLPKLNSSQMNELGAVFQKIEANCKKK